MNNYYNDGGIIFFVVHLNTDFSKKIIYYVCLNKLLLKLYIDSCNSKKQSSISIEFKKMPNSYDEITDIFTNFSIHLNQQLPEKQTTNLNNSSVQFRCFYKGQVYKEDPVKYFLSTPTTIYAIEPIFGTKVAFAFAILKNFSQQCNSSVYIGKTKFYDKFETSESADQIIMKFGKGFIIEGDNKTQTISISYTMNGTLTEVIQDLSFFIEFIKKKSITFKKKKQEFPVDTIDGIQDKYNELVESYEYYKTIKQLFERLEFYEDINIDNIKESDYKKINLLIDCIYNKIPFNHKEEQIKTKVLKICNKKIAVLIVPITKKLVFIQISMILALELNYGKMNAQKKKL